MQFHKQRIKHKPEEGQYGDCFRTALACLLNMEPEDVPHFFKNGFEGWDGVEAWLRTQDLMMFMIPCSCSLEELFAMMEAQNPGVLYLLAGKSPRGVTHQVIACGGKIVHDPSPLNTGIIGPCSDDELYWIDVLLPAHIHYGKE